MNALIPLDSTRAALVENSTDLNYPQEVNETLANVSVWAGDIDYSSAYWEFRKYQNKVEKALKNSNPNLETWALSLLSQLESVVEAIGRHPMPPYIRKKLIEHLRTRANEIEVLDRWLGAERDDFADRRC